MSNTEQEWKEAEEKIEYQMKLEDFLFIISRNDYSVKAAMRASGLSESDCRRLLNKAVEKGLYKKTLIKGKGRFQSPANRFVRYYHYEKIITSSNQTKGGVS